MQLDKRISRQSLLHKLRLLDLDEGIRIESLTNLRRIRKLKIFVNRRVTGLYMIQIEDTRSHRDKSKKARSPAPDTGREETFHYFETAGQVVAYIRRKFGNRYSVWAY